MTCIVAIADEDGVYFGCDSLGTDGHSVTVMSDPKIFQNGEFLIGYAGSYRLGQLLQHSLAVPAKREDQTPKQFLCTDFIDSVRITFDIGHFYNQKYDDEGAGFDGEFLVGYKGDIYLVQGDFSVLHAVEDFTSAGSGSEAANAVLHVTKKLELGPMERLELALETASHQLTSVEPPFHFLTTEEDPKPKKKVKKRAKK